MKGLYIGSNSGNVWPKFMMEAPIKSRKTFTIELSYFIRCPQVVKWSLSKIVSFCYLKFPFLWGAIRVFIAPPATISRGLSYLEPDQFMVTHFSSQP